MADPVITVRCVDIRPEAPDVKTFRLQAEAGALPAFHAGQFVNVAVPFADRTEWRSFTIASSPLRRDAFELTIKRIGKRIGGGGATDRLHRHVAIGDLLQVQGPYGRFCLAAKPERPVILVSAGSGATPMMSMLRWLDDHDHDAAIHYVHCSRRPEDLLFVAEVEAILNRRGNLKVSWIVTSQSGRPDTPLWQTLLPGLAQADVFCCGPEGFMHSVRQAHTAAGGQPDRWHEESFQASAGPEMSSDATSGHTVRFEPAGVAVVTRPGETILEAGLRAGLALMSSCRKGVCSTCRLSKVHGEVEMWQDGGLFDDEVEAGDILACCSRPLGPVTLQFP